MNILEQIVERRRADIAALGWALGADVPERRERGPVVPFVARKGVVLEIKRASPSKGAIAPELDAAAVAAQYVAAGAGAISVLTEPHWFGGSLDDLRAAARASDDCSAMHGLPRIAILRKDFLIAPQEVDIAYRCGADAVLLIARILDTDVVCAMARECSELGMTAFIELRSKDDLRKLAAVVRRVGAAHVVCGVNSRDLRDFSIDLLAPARMLPEIHEAAGSAVHVVFESGIRTADAARFAGGLGFTGMLLGEAAARSPSQAERLVSAFVHATSTANSRWWLEYAGKMRRGKAGAVSRPFVKICGITSLADAQKAAGLGADFLGFVFWKKSPRRADEETVRRISAGLRKSADSPKLIGVVADLHSADGEAALRLLREGVLDAMQLHGCADSFLAEQDAALPHYAAVNLGDEEDLDKIDALCSRGEPRVLLDAKTGLMPGGTGARIADSLVDEAARKARLWLAGGITAENVRSVVERFQPELIDVASGVEAAPGKKDHARLEQLFACL